MCSMIMSSTFSASSIAMLSSHFTSLQTQTSVTSAAVFRSSRTNWDADADRCMFLDEKSEFISGAYVTAMLADVLLTKRGGNNKIIFDPRVIWPAMKVCE